MSGVVAKDLSGVERGDEPGDVSRDITLESSDPNDDNDGNNLDPVSWRSSVDAFLFPRRGGPDAVSDAAFVSIWTFVIVNDGCPCWQHDRSSGVLRVIIQSAFRKVSRNQTICSIHLTTSRLMLLGGFLAAHRLRSSNVSEALTQESLKCWNEYSLIHLLGAYGVQWRE